VYAILQASYEGAAKQCEKYLARRMGMKRCMLIKVLTINILAIFCSAIALENNSIDLSIINDSDGTVLIMFERSLGAASRTKLLEAGEAIDFGRVYEASVQSYSTLWGYIAPAKHILFSSCSVRSEGKVDDITIHLKGITGRSLFHPFGQWDYEVVIGKKAFDFVSAYNLGYLSDNVLEAFPTAKRKIMYTPRYILGLPQYAGLDDAFEAAALLEGKWRLQCVDSSMPQKFALNVIQIIDESRKAFQHGLADVPLHIPFEMRSSLTPQITEQEETEISWS
jgi:hypothetical protein